MKLTDRIKSWFGLYNLGVNGVLWDSYLYIDYTIVREIKQIAQAGIYCEEIS